jgi:hypothetical protein
MGRWLTLVAGLVVLPSMVAAETVKVKVKLANVRRAPDVESPVVSVVPEGTSLEVLGREGDWFKVKLAQGTGYVFARLVESERASEPVASPAPAAPAAPAAAGPSAGVAIDHTAVSCIVAEQNARLAACFDPSESMSRARVNFRATGTPHWYYVEMAPAERCFAGILPRPSKKTKSIDYYIDTVDRAFAESRTQEYAPAVVRKAVECRERQALASTVGAGTIVVGAAPGAPALPAGFLPTGIVAAGSPAAGAAGTQGGGGAPAGAAGAAAGAGISGTTLALIGGGVAAAAAGVAVAAGGGEEDPAQQDRDHDGVTPLAGDCNDNDVSVNPSGAVTFSGARFEATTGVCPDGSSNAPVTIVLLVDGRNNRCAPVTINSVAVTFTITQVSNVNNTVGQQFTFPDQPFSPSTLAAVGRETIRVAPSLTCTNPRRNAQGSSSFDARLSIVTTAGSSEAQTSNVFVTSFPLRAH